ncbi:HAAS signaling domain-containing protein [Paractinoplanes brasiliensis]|uniref:Uncharacterized protein n=1 Tax=Paractinoplanes brasiliensis TaxID=52695 RepID=A0A4R6JQ11_9ACTN|nr:hypothetical protein [Actinoplanes brasiliensis]TDO38643.1 hypothetical protein C8E87_2303 [Actinoplanes brasiliensis]GID26582.1 hypothetical protein Abr02nite_15650 [Actinoplanes brasiliensis]
MNSTAQDEITEYVERVRAALADLPEATRAELLEDLPEHLAEIRAEDTVTLTDRLGTPEAYAAELRATAAGYVGGFPEPPKSPWVTPAEVRAQVMRVLEPADVRIGPVIGYPRASDFLRLLLPAWWVLRGYLGAMAVAYLFDASGNRPGLLPRIGGSTLVALILLAGCVIASILVGQRRLGREGWQRYVLNVGAVFLVLFAIGVFFSADSDVRNPGYDDAGYSGGNPYDYITDVFVYDSTGKLVPGARLFDQEGAPIQMGNAWCEDPETGEGSHSRSMGYPYCPEAAPFGAPSAGSGGVPEPDATDDGSARPPAPAGSATSPSAPSSPAAPPESPGAPTVTPPTPAGR